MTSSMNKLPTELDMLCQEKIYHVFKPEFHHCIPQWLATASDEEKRGIVKLARISEPRLTAHIGRPSNGFEPTMKETGWYNKRSHPVLRPSGSDPMLSTMAEPYEYQIPSWMHEDTYEAEQIPKPGGAILKLKDSVLIQRMKNSQRNTGTYKLFSGQFEGQTAQAACHCLDALGPNHSSNRAIAKRKQIEEQRAAMMMDQGYM
eukprot:TRINITY_DN93228_c0_g1_i1.p1 TRINITY_DN93228_c0_g1~~TRINITY_DN93228_c0_g1_i1.p1  ORF type:complete len:203 (-),score=45.59 TRINITY_DN93228_c0_g1_i1:170-778(-)